MLFRSSGARSPRPRSGRRAPRRAWPPCARDADHGADVVVALTHLETPEDLELLAADTGIDVIVGGHTVGFDGLWSRSSGGPVEIQANPGPVFVKTHRQGRTVGRLDLTLLPRDGGGLTVARARARNLPVTELLEANATVQAMLESYSRRLQAESGTVVGRSLVTLDGENARVRSRETNLGNLLADILRGRYQTDVALVNAVVRARTFTAAMEDATTIVQRMNAASESLRVLGPAPAPLGRLRGEYRVQFLVKSGNRRRMKDVLLAALAAHPEIARRTIVDVDPLSVL